MTNNLNDFNPKLMKRVFDAAQKYGSVWKYFYLSNGKCNFTSTGMIDRALKRHIEEIFLIPNQKKLYVQFAYDSTPKIDKKMVHLGFTKDDVPGDNVYFRPVDSISDIVNQLDKLYKTIK